MNKILIYNYYHGHLEILESTMILFLKKINVNYKKSNIYFKVYKNHADQSKNPEQFINYMKNKYNNVFFIDDIDYNDFDLVVDVTVIGPSGMRALKKNVIVSEKEYIKKKYDQEASPIIKNSKKFYYVSHRINPKFFGNLNNVYYLTPLCGNSNYFIPYILPKIERTVDKNKKITFAVQGNIGNHQRNYQALVDLCKTLKNKFILKIIGRGNMPEKLKEFKNIVLCNNLEWSDFHNCFSDVDYLLPLVDDTFRHNYFTSRYTSSISYIKGYNLKSLSHVKLVDIYNIKNAVIYTSLEDFKNKFSSIVCEYYDKKKCV